MDRAQSLCQTVNIQTTFAKKKKTNFSPAVLVITASSSIDTTNSVHKPGRALCSASDNLMPFP